MFYEKVDNKNLIIPFGDDCDIFPCDTARMRYDKDTHRYCLTEEGLTYYDVDFNEWEWDKLSQKATDHIYEYIDIMAKNQSNVMRYRIAKSLLGKYKTKKQGRLEFEQILAKQADFIAMFGDARKTPKLIVNSETGRLKEQDITLESGYWLDDGVLTWLINACLVDPNIIYNRWDINWSEF